MNIGIFGDLGCGKSAISTNYTIERAMEKKKKIFSNGHMGNLPKGIEFEYISQEELCDFIYKNINDKDKIEEKFRWSILRIEEMENILNARKSGSDLNNVFLQFCRMCGKMDCDLIYDCQVFESDIDLVLRGLTRFRITSERIGEAGEDLSDDDRIPKNPDGSIKKVFFKITVEKYSNGQVIARAHGILDLQHIFNMYKTRELFLLDRSKYLKK